MKRGWEISRRGQRRFSSRFLPVERNALMREPLPKVGR